MELIPRDELKGAPSFNFAPMIDFLFLMLALFATLSVSRATLYDMEIDLAKLKAKSSKEGIQSKGDTHPVHISITALGTYKWLTEFQEYPMDKVEMIQDELTRQYQMGALPQEKSLVEILFHIDRKAPWEPIANAIIAVRELGFAARPVYEPLSPAEPTH